MSDEPEAAGWTAIEAALAEAVGDVAPLHWGTGNLPDQDGPYGLNAYPVGGSLAAGHVGSE